MKHLLSINEDGDASGGAGSGVTLTNTIGGAKKTPLEMGKNHGARTGKKTREKRVDIKAMKSALRDRKNAKPTGKIMSFDNFGKTVADKVVHVNDLSKVRENHSNDNLVEWLIGKEVVINKADFSCECGIVINAKKVCMDDKPKEFESDVYVTIVDEQGENQTGYYKCVK